jgi:sulfite oxidase
MRSPEIRVLSQRPFDGDTSPFALIGNFRTPNHLFYIRNHFAVPPGPDDLEADEHVINILSSDLASAVPLKLTLAELRERFEERHVCATLMCTGGLARRVTGRACDGEHQISTAKWTGVSLCEVLAAAGIRPSLDKDESRHLIMRGLDDFEVSIPLAIVWQCGSAALLAFGMNEEELPRDHGWPLRAIIPGVVGVRSVKWLSRLEVSSQESKSPWHRRIYRIWPQGVKRLEDRTFKDESSEACNTIPVISSILSPIGGEHVAVQARGDGIPCISACGYAFSGGGRRIVRVEITSDDGESWVGCTLQRSEGQPPWGSAWAWTKWHVDVPIPVNAVTARGELQLRVRAVDEAFAHQPEKLETGWNMSGYLVGSQHHVTCRLSARSP